MVINAGEVIEALPFFFFLEIYLKAALNCAVQVQLIVLSVGSEGTTASV